MLRPRQSAEKVRWLQFLKPSTRSLREQASPVTLRSGVRVKRLPQDFGRHSIPVPASRAFKGLTRHGSAAFRGRAPWDNPFAFSRLKTGPTGVTD